MHSAAVLLVGLIFGISSVQSAAAKPVTHEDIKEALINFMHIVRSNTEKLERHENREKQLGELLKRALSALEKRERAQDSVLEKILQTQQSMSDRLEKIERVLSETDYAARGTYTVDSIPGQSMVTQIETLIDKQIDRTANGDRLREVESSINSKIDYLSSVVEKLQANLYNTNSRIENLSDRLGDGSSRERLEKELQAQVETTNSLIRNLEKQVEVLRSVQNDGGDGDLRDVKRELFTELNRLASKIDLKLGDLSDFVVRNERTVTESVTDSKRTLEIQLAELRAKFEDLTKEAKAIGNVEQVLVKTADDVMDTKRRVEHGIFQIRSEVNEYVKSSQAQGTPDLNDTMATRFTGMTETLLENQAGAVANLSTKVESEISQVWRQIGIMHQHITASGNTLDALQNQTNHFVKETEDTMDVMSSKLENIESSIDLVQENNNFLVGRFSLFTHEFNETRNSLAQTTKDLKNILKEIKLHDNGPGPHDIDSADSNIADNKL